MKPEACVVVEDAPAGIRAARAAGMRVVAVVSTHARAELEEAHVTVARLVSIEVSPSDGRPRGRLIVRMMEP